jgi:hypothetical protein
MENIPEETFRARIVLIHTGNTSDMNNYRPISLLNSIYKIFASILQQRLDQGLEPHLQPTQSGFRANKSPACAIHYIRKVGDTGERTGQQTHLVLLGWEKAFDNISREGVFSAMKRMEVPDKLTQLTKFLYNNMPFYIEIDGHASEWPPL